MTSQDPDCGLTRTENEEPCCCKPKPAANQRRTRSTPMSDVILVTAFLFFVIGAVFGVWCGRAGL